MSESPYSLVVAIDGGGTRCRVAAFDGLNTTLVETASANVSTDFDGAVGEVVRGLRNLAECLDCPVDEVFVAPAFVGLAGVTGPVIAERLRGALPLRHIRIADDRPAAVRGVLGQRDGVIGHCGTGSFYAAQAGGEISLAGGWGPVLGDEASAQWVGRAALRLTLETVDGRLDPAPLSEHLLSRFDGAPGIVEFAGKARPSEFGALAPLVTEAAGRGDALAELIMRQGADEIARAIRHLGWTPRQPVCLTGGIGPHYGRYLPADIQACIATSEGEPLDGAISLAQDFAKDISHERS